MALVYLYTGKPQTLDHSRGEGRFPYTLKSNFDLILYKLYFRREAKSDNVVWKTLNLRAKTLPDISEVWTQKNTNR